MHIQIFFARKVFRELWKIFCYSRKILLAIVSEYAWNHHGITMIFPGGFVAPGGYPYAYLDDLYVLESTWRYHLKRARGSTSGTLACRAAIWKKKRKRKKKTKKIIFARKEKAYDACRSSGDREKKSKGPWFYAAYRARSGTSSTSKPLPLLVIFSDWISP